MRIMKVDTTWLVRSKTVPMEPFCLMGIVNVTPDSFSDGGRYYGAGAALAQCEKLIQAGATILDLGGESSRPGAEPVSWEEEWRRVGPVLRELRKTWDGLISIDTYKVEVVRRALDEGADIINDITAGRWEPELLPLVAENRAGYVLMHMLGRPRDMQRNPYYRDVLGEVKAFFQERIQAAKTAGMTRERIVLDPGIGFGKRLEDNLTLISRIDYFLELERPLLLGASRKSFIGMITDAIVTERLPGSIAAVILAYLKGARIFRVHDVAETRQALEIATALLTSGDYIRV